MLLFDSIISPPTDRRNMFHFHHNPNRPQTISFATPTLLDLKPGERATFTGLHAGGGFWGRLIAMGFTPGVEVEMVQNYRRGPLLVSVRGTFVALGRGEAARVLIDRKFI
jgi:ferrous iron transport protein A